MEIDIQKKGLINSNLSRVEIERKKEWHSEENKYL